MMLRNDIEGLMRGRRRSRCEVGPFGIVDTRRLQRCGRGVGDGEF
jgi:hypothetical protein